MIKSKKTESIGGIIECILHAWMLKGISTGNMDRICRGKWNPGIKKNDKR